jgi:hypothetical protein
MSSLGPISLLARAEVRGRRATIAVVVAVAAIVSGSVLTTAAGARRTATVVDRMVAHEDRPAFGIGTYLTTNAGDPVRLRAGEEALTDVPGIEQAIAIANVFVAIGPEDGSWNLAIGTDLDGRYLDSGWTEPLRDGRLPAVDGRGEVAFDASTASRLGVSVGDEFVAPTISVTTMQALISGQASEIVPDGPQLRFTVVGIFRESVTDDPSFGWGVASPDTAAYLAQAGASDSYFLVDGDVDMDAQSAVAVVSEVMGDGGSYVVDLDAELGPVRNTVDIIAAGLALFAVLAAVAGLIALGQVVGRQVAHSGRLADVTAALGMRDRETAIALALPSAIGAGMGIIVGALAAVALSPIFPTGLGRRAEPSPGVRVDWLVLGVGSLVLFVLVSAWAMAAAHRRVRSSGGTSRPPSRGTRSGLRRWLPLCLAIGSGSVLVPNRVRSAARPTSALLGAVLGVTGVLAIAVFTVSQRTTAGDPIRYGWTWDVDSDIAFDDPEQLLMALADEPVLAAVGVADCGQTTIGDDDTTLCALEVLSGSMPMTYLAGRAPSSPDEVAAGSETMTEHDLALGDRIAVTGSNGATKSFEVVGVLVFPDITAPGRGLATTPEGRQTLGDSDGFPILTLKYAPDLDQEEVERVLADVYGLSPDALTRPSPPQLLERLELVRPTLVSLAVFLAVLGLIGLLHFLMLSNARRRHETAVLETIGFVRAQTVAVVVWQGFTIASIGVMVGAPLGVIVGRSVWVASIDHLGIIDTATVPWLFCGLVGAAALVGAAVIGLLTGWRAASRSPSVALRNE